MKERIIKALNSDNARIALSLTLSIIPLIAGLNGYLTILEVFLLCYVITTTVYTEHVKNKTFQMILKMNNQTIEILFDQLEDERKKTRLDRQKRLIRSREDS